MSRVRIAPVVLPEPGVPEREPAIPAATYVARLGRLRAAARARGLDRLVLWADREHAANLAWLTGFDPRFEEAILLLRTDDVSEPALLVGNECRGIVAAAPLPMRAILLQDLSLPDQPRDRSAPLPDILAAEGFGPGSRIGAIGWKPYADPAWLELPAWLAGMLRDAAGPEGSVVNAVDLLIDPDGGLRTINEPAQIAVFEWAACHVSEGVKRVIRGLRPGMTEREAVALLGWNGAPLSCHLMLTAGPRARYGLLSPSDRPMEPGDPFTVAYGIAGGLTCRAGFLVRDAGELPEAIRDYVERLAGPYLETVAAWLAALRVGVTGGELQAIVERGIGDPFFGLFINPGHLLHLDEWVASPVAAGSSVPLRSGMVIQSDIIPATGSPWFTSNIEDGYAIADAELRAELAVGWPDLWRRVGIRRALVRDLLGVELHPDVLPLSNIAGWLPPFLLGHDRALTLTR